MPEVDLSRYHCIACFNSTLLENMGILSSMKNYYNWIGSEFKKYAGKRVIDIGCANGTLTSLFVDREFLMGADYYPPYVKQFNKDLKKYKNVSSTVVDATNKKQMLALKKNAFDTVISMNTYEHIKDDQAAFDNAYALLERGGRMIILVPAGMWLYSILDFEGGHFRRYSRPELLEKMRKAGFRIEESHYMNVPGALGWYVMHVLLKKRIFSTGSFNLYNKLAPLFRLVEQFIRPPFGLSVIAVGKKD